ncbi:MFS transporter [Paenibacillus sp. 481]|uniref:MFS transporter n=1 Tax=Paenibacillus sp. 481 TaxID=2835869 RepID=UPI001E346169|nr:MFS transporter [Paenibacillus sp. 481]UHA74099.1 MFS transporter [Paenibacillus sp. 481]
MFNLLGNSEFAKLFWGRVVANLGDSFYMIAAMWLVYDLGGSTFYTGLAVFLISIPCLFQFLLGPLIDYWPLRRMLAVSQICQAVLLLMIPVAYAFQFLSVTFVLTIMPIIALLNQLVYPAQSSALPKLLSKEDLTKGNSLFMVANQGSDAAFNALAGVLVGLIGAISLFYMNAVVFVVSALIFASLKVVSTVVTSHTSVNSESNANFSDTTSSADEKYSKPASSSLSQMLRTYGLQLKEGITILLNPYIIRIMFGVLVINFAGGAIFAILPQFGASPNHYGFLLSAIGIGSIIGYLIAPRFNMEKYKLGMLYVVAFLVCGLAWIVSAQISIAWLSILVFGLGWVPGGVTNIVANVFLQTIVPEHLMGRVYAATASFGGLATPLGSLAGGYVGQMFSSHVVVMLGGLLIVLVSLYWLIDPVIRRMPAATQFDATMLIEAGVHHSDSIGKIAKQA